MNEEAVREYFGNLANACGEKLQAKQTHFTLFDLVLNLAFFSLGMPLFVIIILAIAYKIDVPLFSMAAASTKITDILNRIKSKFSK